MKSIFKEPLYIQDFGLSQIYEFERKISEAAGDHFQLVSEKEKGYLLFKEKFVGDVLFEKVSDGKLNLQFKVNAQMRKGVTYISRITLSEQNEILGTSCSCVAGKFPATCKHIFASFHMLMDYSQKELYVASTEKLQEWHKPKGVQVSAKPFGEVFGKKKGAVPKRTLNYSALFSGKQNFQFLSVHTDSEKLLYSFTIPLPACVLSHRPQNPFGELNFEQVVFLVSKLKFDLERIWELEYSTMNQRNNEQWKKERKYRITSSNFYDICNCKVQENLPEKILTEKDLSNVGPISYGIENEPYVRNMVRNLFPHHVIRKVGLVSSPFMPHLAASPDGLLYSSESVMLLEIKCIYNAESKNLEELTKNKNFCLEKRNDTYVLKRSHKFYYQIQGQLALSNLDECLLVIYYKKPAHIITTIVKFDPEFWRITYEKLHGFYINFYLPKLIQKLNL